MKTSRPPLTTATKPDMPPSYNTNLLHGSTTNNKPTESFQTGYLCGCHSNDKSRNHRQNILTIHFEQLTMKQGSCLIGPWGPHVRLMRFQGLNASGTVAMGLTALAGALIYKLIESSITHALAHDRSLAKQTALLQSLGFVVAVRFGFPTC